MMNNKEQAIVFKAFCDENRILILNTIKYEEKCACKILEKLEISQSTLSYHMKILVESEIVKSRKVGKWTHYKINKEQIKLAKKILETFDV